MRTRKTSNPPRHPFPRLRHPICVTLLVCLLLVLAAGPASSVPISRPGQSKPKPPAEDFLIFGTVFSDQGFTVQGAKIEVRRAGEKKVRGRAFSDRRGEFGIRVPLGHEYEVRIEARGYQKAGRKVKAEFAQRFDFVERLKPLDSAPQKKGQGEQKP